MVTDIFYAQKGILDQHMRFWHLSEVIAHAQVLLINAHPDVVSGVRDLMLGLSLRLYPYSGEASSEGSGESAHLRRLA